MNSNSLYHQDSEIKTTMNVKICLNTKVCMQNKILASTVQNLKRQNTSALVYVILKRWIPDAPNLSVGNLPRILYLHDGEFFFGWNDILVITNGASSTTNDMPDQANFTKVLPIEENFTKELPIEVNCTKESPSEANRTKESLSEANRMKEIAH